MHHPVPGISLCEVGSLANEEADEVEIPRNQEHEGPWGRGGIGLASTSMNGSAEAPSLGDSGPKLIPSTLHRDLRKRERGLWGLNSPKIGNMQ